MLLQKEMSYVEFKGFFECLEKKISQKEFEINILQKYQSTKKGITLKGLIYLLFIVISQLGFKDFWKDSIKNNGEGVTWKWLE
jgi:hypothetical protein